MNKKKIGRSHLNSFHRTIQDVITSPYTQQSMLNDISEIVEHLESVMPLWDEIVNDDNTKLRMHQSSYVKLLESVITITERMDNIAGMTSTSNVFMKIADAEGDLEQISLVLLSIKKTEYVHP